MDNIITEMGRIYCQYNEAIDDFKKVRVLDVNAKENRFFVKELNDEYHCDSDTYYIDIDELKKDWVALASEGIMSVTNVVTMSNEIREIKDVIVIFFPNNRVTHVPDVHQPYIVARQGINNIFAEFAGYKDRVGMSVSLDTLPTDYALSDFMSNERALDSKVFHVYKTDTAYELALIGYSESTNKVFKELQEGRIFYLKNTSPKWKDFDEKTESIDEIDGYCKNLKIFLTESGYMEDLYNTIGIIKVDCELKANEPLSIDDRLLVSTIAGGIKINKAVPLAFGYDINMEAIKMKYFLINDINNKLWIVPYTESPEEVSAEELYNLTEERTKLLQERLSKVVKAYDMSKGIESGSAADMLTPIDTTLN